MITQVAQRGFPKKDTPLILAHEKDAPKSSAQFPYRTFGVLLHQAGSKVQHQHRRLFTILLAFRITPRRLFLLFQEEIFSGQNFPNDHRNLF